MAATIFQTVAASLRLPHEVYRRWVPFFPPSQKQVESRTPAPGVLPWSEPEVSALRLLVGQSRGAQGWRRRTAQREDGEGPIAVVGSGPGRARRGMQGGQEFAPC